MKKRRIIVGVVICFLMGLIASFLWHYHKNLAKDDAPYKLYYVNSQITSLNTAPYEGEMKSTDTAVEDMLKKLKIQVDIEMLPAIPEDVEVTKYSIEYGKLYLYFNNAYYQMDSVREVMCRAAVVCSLTQIPGISEVMFYVEEEPLTNKEGTPYGYMRRQEFVQNTGSSINSYEMTGFDLYFANTDGDGLVEEHVTIKCNSGQARESVAIECLLKGPNKVQLIQTLPKETKLLNVSIHNGVCYLNFNEGLKNTVPDVKPE